MIESLEARDRAHVDAVRDLAAVITGLTEQVTNHIPMQVNALNLEVSNLRTAVNLTVKYIVPMVVGVVSLLIGLVAGRAGI